MTRPKCREDIFITSKLHPRNQNYDAAKKAVTESLEQLETEFIDLYLIHWPGTSKLKPEDPMNAENRRTSWEALEEAYKNEKSVRGEELSAYPTLRRRICDIYWRKRKFV